MKDNLKERLDKLRAKIQTRDFLLGNGLSNEVNIWVFCYEPKDEMIVCRTVEQMKTDQSMQCRIHECNLYETFIEICKDKRILQGIPQMEERKGKEFLLKQIHSITTERVFVDKMLFDMERGRDVLVLTGVGDVFPFMRVHSLLEAMQPYFSDIPVLVMYPGTFNGAELKLFDKLSPNAYYRAFNNFEQGDKK